MHRPSTLENKGGGTDQLDQAVELPQIFFSFVRAAGACAVLGKTSEFEPSSEATAPRYLKLYRSYCTETRFCFLPLSPLKRGAVVKWLGWLGYRAESRQKVVSSRLGFAIRQLENYLYRRSSKGIFFRIRE